MHLCDGVTVATISIINPLITCSITMAKIITLTPSRLTIEV